MVAMYRIPENRASIYFAIAWYVGDLYFAWYVGDLEEAMNQQQTL